MSDVQRSLTSDRKIYKPFWYEWAIEACETQQKMHWLPYEIDMLRDIQDFENNLTPTEKEIINKVLRFFTQIDFEVFKKYSEYYINAFYCPEIRMMLISFANMEVIHTLGYAFLITALRLPDSEYAEFLKYKEMVDKYDYMQTFDISNPQGTALTMAIVSGFIEGLVLFSSFTILMYFSTLRGDHIGSVLQGLGQIVSFSIRDETLHCLSIMRLFREYVSENRDKIDMKKLEADIHKNCLYIVELENSFIDLVFDGKSLDYLTADELKGFIKYLANLRLNQMGFSGVYEGYSENPLPWTNTFLIYKELTNFFDNTASNYGKANFDSATIDLKDVWDK